MSDFVWPHRRQPTRLPCPWDSPGKNVPLMNYVANLMVSWPQIYHISKGYKRFFFTSGNADYKIWAPSPSPSSPSSPALWWCPCPAPGTFNPCIAMFDGVNVMKSTRWKEDAGMCMRQQRNNPRLSVHSLTLPAARPASRWMNQSLSREFSSGLPLLCRHLIWENFNHVCFPMFRPNDKSFLMGG